MHVLDFVVLKQLITYKPCRPLIADSVGHVYANFIFDEEWDGLSVTAVFKNSSQGTPVEVLLTEERMEIPPEVLVDGHLFVSLVGTGDNGNIQVPTASMSMPVRVYRSGDLVGVAPDQRTPDLWAQVLAAIGPLSKLDTKDKSNLVAAINEVLKHGGTEAVTAENITKALGYAPEQELVMGVAEVSADGSLVIYVPEGTAIKTGTQLCYREPSVTGNVLAELSNKYATISGKQYLFVTADRVEIDAKELHKKNDTIIIRIDEEIGDPLFAQVIATVPKEQEGFDSEGVALSGCYKTERVDYGVTQETLKTDYLIGLYNKLVADHPDCVSVEEITTDDGLFTNYAYTFSAGEYNTKGTRGELDTYIKKPKYLVLSGIHGREKAAVMSTYHFFRDLVEGKNLPTNFREGAIFKILPVANPFGFNQKGIYGVPEPDFGRANENGVDLNRNFDYNWVSDTTPGRYSGEYAGSEQETKVIMKWLEANRDARLFIDHHNSSANDYKEVAMVVGLNTHKTKRSKCLALKGLDRIIPSWRSEFSGYDKIYSYSSFNELNGVCIYYADEKIGISSLVLETSTRQDDPDTFLTPVSIAVGAEAVGNILLEFFEQSDEVNYAEEGQFAVSDGEGGIKWMSVFAEDEVGY